MDRASLPLPVPPVDTDHAGLMDRQYRYQRHIYDLTRKYYLFGRDRLLDGLDVKPGEKVLEVGCGTGRNIGHMMDRYPGAWFFGLDISREMLETAEKRFARRGGARPRLAVADATAFTAADFGEAGFNRVVVSYALSMIPAWQEAIERAFDALAPGGSLHIVDFGQQERLPTPIHRLLQGWLTRFHVTPRPHLFEVLQAAAQRRGAHVAAETPYGGYAWLAIAKMPD
jgi:S-adenosylmethionine-diacylgycerolhomoserine-N-methlytransferase